MNVTISSKIVNNITFDIITIKNDVNFEIKLINYGAKIISIKYLDNKGKNYSVLNCPKDLSHVLSYTNNYGSTIGPVAGRIKNGEFISNDIRYEFEKNEKGNCLHSGNANFGFKLFYYKIKQDKEKTIVTFLCKHKHGDSGFPGNIDANISYVIYSKTKQFDIIFDAITDRKSFINLTNHMYFNLNGGVKPIYNHQLYLRSHQCYSMNDDLTLIKLENAPDFLNFSKEHTLDVIKNPLIYDKQEHGMDHVFELDSINLDVPSAILYNPDTKRKLTLFTNYPAIVVYTDNYPGHVLNAANVMNDENFGITFETVIPTLDLNILTFDKDKKYHFITKYLFD